MFKLVNGFKISIHFCASSSSSLSLMNWNSKRLDVVSVSVELIDFVTVIVNPFLCFGVEVLDDDAVVASMEVVNTLRGMTSVTCCGFF